MSISLDGNKQCLKSIICSTPAVASVIVRKAIFTSLRIYAQFDTAAVSQFSSEVFIRQFLSRLFCRNKSLTSGNRLLYELQMKPSGINCFSRVEMPAIIGDLTGPEIEI
jgi:hypothetical protein